MLLSYLVTSRARRHLLRLLWADGAEGSVSDLARRARVSFAAAHRELEAMRARGPGAVGASRRRARLSGRPRVPGGQPGPTAPRGGCGRIGAASRPDSERVRGWLAAAGAPLLVSAARRGIQGRGWRRSSRRGWRFPTATRPSPGCCHSSLWRHRDRLDHGRLVRAATRRNERQALGFFLELTGRLGGDRRLASLSERPAGPSPQPGAAVLCGAAGAHGPGSRAQEDATSGTPVGLSHEHGDGQLRLGLREAR